MMACSKILAVFTFTVAVMWTHGPQCRQAPPSAKAAEFKQLR